MLKFPFYKIIRHTRQCKKDEMGNLGQKMAC